MGGKSRVRSLSKKLIKILNTTRSGQKTGKIFTQGGSCIETMTTSFRMNTYSSHNGPKTPKTPTMITRGSSIVSEPPIESKAPTSVFV